MTYPLISEYVAAIKNAADNLDKLQGLQPVFDDCGEPVHSSGAFAVVFKMVDANGKFFALKCFTEEQTGRAEAYKMIAKELEIVNSSYIMKVEYYDKEVFVDSNITEDTEFPVLLMDWIDGVTMDVFIANNYADEYEMSWLCYRFCKMAAWLRSQPFAHGDIKPDNIIVREDGELVLIDYDGMYVPAMKGQKSPTLGTKDFVHPNRKIEDFDELIDDFTLASIALSLKAISLDSLLYEKYAAPDRLCFSVDDYLNLAESKVITALQSLLCDIELMKLEGLFKYSLATGSLSSVSFRSFMLGKPEKEKQYTDEELTELCRVTEEELDSIEWDETGAKYSKDGKRLLRVAADAGWNGVAPFKVKDGTLIICDYAFNGLRLIESITIPKSVIKIGYNVFCDCSYLGEIVVDSNNKTYDSRDNCNAVIETLSNMLIAGCGGTSIPTSVTSIGPGAFHGCDNFESILIPSSVTCIGSDAFSYCEHLKSINLSNGVSFIGDNAFQNCCCIASITLPSSITTIGKGAFCGTRIQSAIIPSSVSIINAHTFAGCRNLQTINIPPSVKVIGFCAFEGCSNLISINLPSSVTSIDSLAFSGCSKLTSITIPSKVTSIGDQAFACCVSLKSITILNRFDKCPDDSNTGIIAPSLFKSIGFHAFDGCNSLESIFVPQGTRLRFMKMLPDNLHSKIKETSRI